VTTLNISNGTQRVSTAGREVGTKVEFRCGRGRSLYVRASGQTAVECLHAWDEDGL